MLSRSLAGAVSTERGFRFAMADVDGAPPLLLPGCSVARCPADDKQFCVPLRLGQSFKPPERIEHLMALLGQDCTSAPGTPADRVNQRRGEYFIHCRNKFPYMGVTGAHLTLCRGD
jgi:hypothetical protein